MPRRWEPLLHQIDMPIAQFTADGAYNGEPTYDAVRHAEFADFTLKNETKSSKCADEKVSGAL